MENEGGLQEHLLDPAFLSDLDPNLCSGEDGTILDATDQGVDSILDTGGLHYYNTALTWPIFPSNGDFGASYIDAVASTDNPAFRGTPYVDNSANVVRKPHILPPKITYPRTDDFSIQEAPVLYVPSDASSRTFSDSHITSLALPIQTRYLTAEDWEHHRALITQLYRDENNTLKEVISIMKERYGFNATDKMYKKRINDWQLHKNCKASEKEEILRCVERNRKLGANLGEPMVNGRKVKMHIIERHRKEKRKSRSPSPSVIDGRSAKRGRPPGPTCSAAISFSKIGDPTDYRNYENLLFQVDQFYTSKLENDPLVAWNAWQQSSRHRQVKVSYTFLGSTYTCGLNDPRDVFHRYRDADDLLLDGHTREAWRMIQEGAELVRPSLLQESPNFIRELLAYLSTNFPVAHIGVKMQFLRLISGMAIVVHGDRHPISNICRLLQLLHGKRDIIKVTMTKLRDILMDRLGQKHYSVIVSQQILCGMLVEWKRYAEAERSLCDLSKSCECFLGRNAYVTRTTLLQLAALYYLMRKDTECEDVLADLLQRGEKRGGRDAVNFKSKLLQCLKYFAGGESCVAKKLLWPALSGSLL